MAGSVTDVASLPAAALAHYNAGRLADARVLYGTLLALYPTHPDALHFLGIVAARTGRHADAERWLDRAIRTVPASAHLHNSLGIVLNGQGRRREALDCFRTALALDRDFAPTLHNLPAMLHDTGRALLTGGRPVEAEAHFRAALALRPGSAESLHGLGLALNAASRPQEAGIPIARAIVLKPEAVEARHDLGIVLRTLGRSEDAQAQLQRALALQPQQAEAWNSLAIPLKDEGRIDAAANCLRRAVALRPDYVQAHSNLLVTLPFSSSADGPAVFAQARRYGALFGEPPAGHGNDRNPERPLRVGYLSPSLSAHVLAPYIEPVLRAHRRDRVEVHVYAHVPRPDAVTRRLMEAADRWTFVQDLSDDAVAARIREDGIDILVEPMGHWADNRLPVFARKPAPIQVSYLCQGLTTGLPPIDYAIGDRWLNEGGAMQRFATEQVVMLEGGFQTTVYGEAPPTGEPPSAAAGTVTFGSFNNPAKISDGSLRLWSLVLDAAPGSRLLVKGKGLEQSRNRDLLMARLVRHGIAPGRVDIVGLLPGWEYLTAYRLIDVALDTVPFTGGRTTVDALWMGVPVVTLVGDTVYGRYSLSHLMRIGCPELAARTAGDYVATAAELAGDPDRLRHYRENLRPAILRSSLCDAASHVAELEQAFRAMWRRWCAGLPAAGFTVAGA